MITAAVEPTPAADEPDAPDDAPGEHVARRRDTGLAFLATTSLVLGVLLVRNRLAFSTALYEEGDLAADSRLVESARNLKLFYGQYSRFGFHHPGPVYLYVRGFGESMLHDLLGVVPALFNGQFIAVLVLNAAIVGATAMLLARRTSHPVMFAVAFGLARLAAGIDQPGILSYPWMPLVVIWPFALFLVASADVMDGRLRSMPYLVAGAALCISGSVNMVPFIGAGILVVGVRLWKRGSTVAWRAERRSLVVAAAIAAAFAVPLLADLARGSASNVTAIWRYATSATTYAHSWRASLGYTARFWFHGAPGSRKPLVVAVLLVALALLLVEATRNRASSTQGQAASQGGPTLDTSLLRPLLLLVGVETVLGLLYAHRYVDDLHLTYIEVFQLACPIVVFGAAGIALVDLFSRRLDARPAPTYALAGLLFGTGSLTMLVIAGHDSTPAGLHTRGVDATAAVLRERFGDQTVAIDFQLSEWEQGVALFVYEHRRGHPVCFANPDFLAMRAMPAGDQCGPLDASGARVRLVRTTAAASDTAATGTLPDGSAALGEITGHNGTVSVRAVPVTS